VSSVNLGDYWHHTFRQSFLGTVQKCPEMARSEYFGEVVQEMEDTDTQARGTAVHAGIEYALAEKRDAEVPSMVEVIDVGHHELELLWPWREEKYKRRTIEQQLDRMLTTWYKGVLPHVHPAVLEHTFKYQFHADAARLIDMSGTIDCVDVDGLVWDWKTSSREYEPWEYQRWAVQPTVYTWAQWHHDHSDEARTMDERHFRYVVLLEGGGLQYLDVTRQHEHVEWLTAQCVQVAQMIETNPGGPWPLLDGGWWCSQKWCPKFDQCKGLAMHDHWQQTLK
jgi:hypothetical protein